MYRTKVVDVMCGVGYCEHIHFSLKRAQKCRGHLTWEYGDAAFVVSWPGGKVVTDD